MRNRLRLIVMLTAVLAIAAPASAQIAQPTLRSTRPARGLFGGGIGDVSQSLILTGSVGGGYDKTEGGQISSAPGLPTTTSPPWVGSFGTASTALADSLSKGPVNGGANIDARARFRDGQSNSFNAIGFGGNIAWDITSRTSLMASQGFSRQPRNLQAFYGGGFDASAAPTTVFDLSGATSLTDYTTSQTAVRFRQGVTTRIEINAGYSYYTYFGSADLPTNDSRTSTLAAGIAYQIARGVYFRIGYGSSIARYGESDVTTRYNGLVMDGGLDFSRSLSLTRRSSLSFSTGLTGARDEVGATRYFVTARGNLSYEIGRSWTSALNYNRGVDFNQFAGQPVVMDTVSAGLSGDLSRRFQVSTGFAGSWGAIGLYAGSSGYNAYTATASLRTAMTRELGISVQYAYRHYLVDDPGSLPFGMPPSTDRQSIRATLDVWVPLFTRARRPDATR